jgi:hypothetical protein
MVLTGGVSLHSARRRLCGEILPLIFEPDIVLSLYRSTVSVLTSHEKFEPSDGRAPAAAGS